jgi:hypothetical protein
MTYRSSLAGTTSEVSEAALLEAVIDGYHLSTFALVRGEIGKDDDGNSIDVLLSELSMQQWGIRPMPEKQELDMSRYPSTLVEF